MKNKIQGFASLLLATMIWGSAFVAQSVGMDHVGPFTFQAVRCFLAVIGLLPIIRLMDRISGKSSGFFHRWKDRRLWIGGILCGIPLFLACNLQQLGIMDTDAGKSAFLTAMYVVLVPILGLFLKRKPGKYIPLSVVLSVIGLYLLSSAGGFHFRVPDLLLLGCALMFAVQIMLVDHFAPGLDALRLNLIQALVCAVLSTVCTLILESPTAISIWECRLPLAYAGFLSMGAAYSLQILGQKHLEPATASLIMSLEAVFAAVFGWIILQQAMALPEIIGSLLILAAIVAAQLPEKR